MGDPLQLDPGRSAWLGRLPAYLYLRDLVDGRRVLEVGCGAGYGARFLADLGAASVIGVDGDASAVAEARARHRLTNLEFRCEDAASLEIEDSAVDCAFLPAGVDLMRRTAVLTELRRVLAPSGRLVLCGTSADRPAAEHGASYHEFLERLGALFPPVRMVAQSPFVGLCLVEYGEEGAPDPEVELDTTLLELAGDRGEVTDYVAICGGPEDAALRALAIVQLPTPGGVGAVAKLAGAPLAPAAPSRAIEGEAAPIAPADRGSSREGEETERAGEAELRRRLELAVQGQRRAEAESGALRRQLEEAWDQAGRAAGEADAEVARARTELAGLRQRVAELEGEIARQGARAAEAQADRDEEDEVTRVRFADQEPGEPEVEAPADGEDEVTKVRLTSRELGAPELEAGEGEPSITERVSRALSAHGEAVRALEEQLEERQSYTDELRDELDSAREALARAEERSRARQDRIGTLERELRGWRDRASVAEGELMRAERSSSEEGAGEPTAAPRPAPPVPLAGRRRAGAGAPPDSKLGEKLSALANRVLALENELSAERHLVAEIEGGIAALREEAAGAAADEAPSAWAAQREERLRALAGELGMKDAELTLLHVGVSSLRDRVREVVGEVRKARERMQGRSAPEMEEMLDRLSERLSAYES